VKIQVHFQTAIGTNIICRSFFLFFTFYLIQTNMLLRLPIIRSWFHFGIRGAHGKYVKFNLMNLNKQARLFEMGMLPVFKSVPGHEKWSRIYTKPNWQVMLNSILLICFLFF
jgi:hypothetical protein